MAHNGVSQLITEWVAPIARLRLIKTQIRHPVYAHDAVCLSGHITRTRETPDGKVIEPLVRCDRDLKTPICAEAIVSLPEF